MPRKRSRYEQTSIYPVERAERIAKIMGENSAAAQALVDLKRRIAAGEDAVLLVSGAMILVGPRPQGAQ